MLLLLPYNVIYENNLSEAKDAAGTDKYLHANTLR